MSVEIEGAYEGGADRPSVVSEDGPAWLAQSETNGVQKSIGHLVGDETSDGFNLSLRDPLKRENSLRELLKGVCPPEANAEIWASWLNGGEHPFANAKLKRLALVTQSTRRTVDMSSTRVKAAVAKVESAANVLGASNKVVSDAEQRLEEAKVDLANAKAYDASLIQSDVSEHLVSIMAPMFAMGPAWTVMRALSAHSSPSMLESMTSFFTDESKRQSAQEKMKLDRPIETGEVLACLDLWCGDDGFEEALRGAIVSVTKRYAARDRDGMLARKKETTATSIRAEAIADQAAILAGFGSPPSPS